MIIAHSLLTVYYSTFSHPQKRIHVCVYTQYILKDWFTVNVTSTPPLLPYP